MVPKKSNKPEKKAAIELSIGTVVIIVLAMAMLVLGIVLVRNIFTGAIDVADVTNERVRSQIINIFAEESSTIALKLGSDRVAKVEAGGDPGYVNFGVRPDGLVTSRSDAEYELTADTNSRDNCIDLLGGSTTGERKVQEFFNYDFDSPIAFDRFDSAVLFGSIQLTIPDGTPTCTQKIFIDVVDERPDSRGEAVGSDYFIIEVAQGGIFS